MTQSEVTKMLRDARRYLKDEDLQALLPAPLKIRVGSHDTGCQVYITATAEGLPEVPAWLGSIWYSEIYNFNDERKTLGLQPAFEQARDMIESFFTVVAEKARQFETAEANRVEAAKAKAEDDRAAATAKYLSMLPGRSA